MSGKVGKGKLLKSIVWKVEVPENPKNVTSIFQSDSSTFSIENRGLITQWKLMHSFNDRGSKQIGLYLKPQSRELINFDCTYDVIVVNHADSVKSKFAPDDENTRRRRNEWPHGGSWGVEDLLSHAELFKRENSYIKDGKIQFIVTMFEDSSNDQSRSIMSQSVDAFEDFFNESVTIEPETVKLKCSDGVELIAFKRAICRKSAVMQAMFENDMEEKKNGSVNVIDFDSDVMKELLRFMYIGKMRDKNEIDLLKLYEAAKVYMLNDLKVLCVDAIIGKLTADNLMELIEFADVHDETELYELCLLLIHRLYIIPKSETKNIDELPSKLQARIYKDLLKIATGDNERYCKVYTHETLQIKL